ncbi:Uncharacterized protein SCF082_LOCUS19803, partial [Durusdinium trenchii]
AALEEAVAAALHPSRPGAVDLHHVEGNIRFRAWVRNAFLHRRFEGSRELMRAELEVFAWLPEAPTMAKVDDVFGTKDWDRHPTEREDGVQRELVAQYERNATDCAQWSLEDLLEAVGCCVKGMNAFNWFCEKHFIYEFLTRDYAAKLWEHIERRSEALHEATGQTEFRVAEVGAGTGQLTFLLRQAADEARKRKGGTGPSLSWDLRASDTGTWSTRHKRSRVKPLELVERMTYTEALAAVEPDFVLCSWMPLGTDWTQDFRNAPSVKEYILIGEVDDGCCGHPWLTWGQHVHQTNDPMFAKNRDRQDAVLAHNDNIDIFHWLGNSVKSASPGQSAFPRPDEPDIVDPDPADRVAPYARDGFVRADLGLADLQLSRYDRAHFAANSHTVSFSREAAP